MWKYEIYSDNEPNRTEQINKYFIMNYFGVYINNSDDILVTAEQSKYDDDKDEVENEKNGKDANTPNKFRRVCAATVAAPSNSWEILLHI